MTPRADRCHGLPVVIDGDGRPVPVGGTLADGIVGATERYRPGAGTCPG